MKRFAVGDKFEVIGIFGGRPSYHEIAKIENGEITTIERWVAEDTWENCEETSTFKIEIDEAAGAERIEVWEYMGEHGYVWATNEEKEESNLTMFTLNGIEYKTNDKGNYYYKSTGNVDKKGQPVFMRIAKHVWEQAFEEYTNTVEVEDETPEINTEIPNGFTVETFWDGDTYSYSLYRGNKLEGRYWNSEDAVKRAKELVESDKEAEDVLNNKKARKPRRSKDIAYELKTEGGNITLTTKQLQFIKLLPDDDFFENGADSTLWTDVYCDTVAGAFSPMAVGAMISTLREKNLIYVQVDKVNGKKSKYFGFTELGKKMLAELGLV